MFCSWKKRADAPCSCAYRLRSPAHELLNHLCHLGNGTLVIRRSGLSLVKWTCFGLHIASREGGWNLLHDSISGLETRLGTRQNAYLLTEASDPRPLFAMGPPDRPIEFSVRLDGHVWQSPAIQHMIRRFDGMALNCLQSRLLGAGAWLDEWEQTKKPFNRQSAELLLKTSTDVMSCERLEIDIRTSCHRNITVFQPSFIDMEGSVLRIADKRRHHIVYADVHADGFSLRTTEGGHLRLSHES